MLPAELPRCQCGHVFAHLGADLDAALRGHSVHSHYDNLKVSRDAPPEVIRAAYRALCRTYHPDHRAGDPRAVQVMQLLNAAYEVLSDPDRRKAHDDWIARASSGPSGAVRPPRVGYPVQPTTGRRDSLQLTDLRSTWQIGVALLTVALLAASAAVVYFRDELGLRDSALAKRQSASPALAAERPAARASSYLRRPVAPNGMPWPEATGYVEGYARLRSDGPLALLLDNSRNHADVFAKLVALDDPQPMGVRAIFVKAGEGFVLEGVRPGTYEIRFRDLDTGIVSRTTRVILQELTDISGAPAEPMAITLPGPQGPALDSTELSGGDF